MGVWKPIEGTDGRYEVSPLGKIRSLKDEYGRNRTLILTNVIHHACGGYVVTSIIYKGKYKQIKLHRVVAEAFIPNPENKRTVNHIDGNKQNNRIENLEWATHKENVQHSYDTGLKFGLKGSKQNMSKLTEEIVLDIRRRIAENKITMTAIAKEYNVSIGAISLICSRKTWLHI